MQDYAEPTYTVPVVEHVDAMGIALDGDYKKSLSFCQTVRPITEALLKALKRGTNATWEFYIGKDGGTLVCFVHDKPYKMHSTVDKIIDAQDKWLQSRPHAIPGQTHFVSLSDKFSCKVKTLERGDHKYDEHYNLIFDSKTIGKCIGRKHNIRDAVVAFTEKETYDVVKKQKVIDGTSAFVGVNAAEVLLGKEGAKYFYDFSSDCLAAIHSLSLFECRIREEETSWMSTDLDCIAKNKDGFVYAAWNPCIGRFIKLGATMRDSPTPRLKELSSCLPDSFKLIACVRSKNPFALERRVHQQFGSFRVKKDTTGRNTEFFMVSHEDVCSYFFKLIEEGC